MTCQFWEQKWFPLAWNISLGLSIGSCRHLGKEIRSTSFWYIHSLSNQCTISAVSKDGKEGLWTTGHDLCFCATDRDVLNICTFLEQVPQTCKNQTEYFCYFQFVSAWNFRKKDAKRETHLLSGFFPGLSNFLIPNKHSSRIVQLGKLGDRGRTRSCHSQLVSRHPEKGILRFEMFIFSIVYCLD